MSRSIYKRTTLDKYIELEIRPSFKINQKGERKD